MNKRLYTITALTLALLCVAETITIFGISAEKYDGVNVSGTASAQSGVISDNPKFDQIEQIYQSLMQNYYMELDSTKLIEGAIDGMLAVANDPYTFYYTADEWAAAMNDNEGVYAGIGIQVLDSANADYMLITRCFKDSPAHKAGLRAGDRIMLVDGFSVAAALGGKTPYAQPDAAKGEAEDKTQPSEQDSAAKKAPSNRTELLAYMRGKEGSKITLTIQRGDETFESTLTREIIHMNRVEYCMLDGEQGTPDVGYMAIYEFQGDAAQGVKQALEYFEQQGAKALVVDLRNNPGGNLDVITQVVEDLLPEGLYAYIEDRQGNRQEFYSDAKCWGKPMAVLVNGYSASASELFTGAAKDMGAAVIVGETTFGKGIVQSVVGLNDGSGYQFTSARYFTPSGHVIQGNGIEPNIVVKPDGEYDSSILGALIAEGGLDWQKHDNQLLTAYNELLKELQEGWKLPTIAQTAQSDGAAEADKQATVLPNCVSDFV